MWVPHPSEIVVLADGGSGNMGDVTDEVSRARFKLDADRFVPAFVRVTFTGGSGSADMAVRIDSRLGDHFDHTLFTFEAVGTDGSQVHYRIPADELYEWLLLRGDELVFEWTNPNGDNTQAWAAEVGMINAEAQPQ